MMYRIQQGMEEKNALTSLYSVVADHTNSGLLIHVFQFAFTVAANGTIYLQPDTTVSKSNTNNHLRYYEFLNSL